ncbi:MULTISPECIES: DUF2007 domain-containing protein [unclassified Lysobacter]|uniref:putative signal transducing protein n=1 Tax=unclassified Lysobacter TaxID=2635362 RepID=UPI001C23C544|nr:DUF2007 domain-containing protein [Lysobacter sp. MMG2]MBU8975415.1 DUF2007 domain-containing protein [Lysobacter sp. MMG2]
MKVVYQAANLIDAHLVRHALEAQEIPVFLQGEALTGGMGELPLFGTILVCVPDVVWPEASDIVATLPLNQPAAAEPDDDEAADSSHGWLPA